MIKQDRYINLIHYSNPTPVVMIKQNTCIILIDNVGIHEYVPDGGVGQKVPLGKVIKAGDSWILLGFVGEVLKARKCPLSKIIKAGDP